MIYFLPMSKFKISRKARYKVADASINFIHKYKNRFLNSFIPPIEVINTLVLC